MIALTSLVLLAQAPTAAMEKKEQQPMQSQAETMQALSSMMEGRSTMIIDPKARINDYIKAFELLKQEKAVSKIFIQIRGGMKLSNIIDIKAMPENTLVIIRYNSPQGIKFQVVGIEDILSIEHL